MKREASYLGVAGRSLIVADTGWWLIRSWLRVIVALACRRILCSLRRCGCSDMITENRRFGAIDSICRPSCRAVALCYFSCGP